MTFLAICDKTELGRYLAQKPKYTDYKGRCEYIIAVTTFNKKDKGKEFVINEIHDFVFVAGVAKEHSVFDNSKTGLHRRGRNVPITKAELVRIVGKINYVVDNFHRNNNKLYFINDVMQVFMPRVNFLPLNALHNPSWEFTNIDLRFEMLSSR